MRKNQYDLWKNSIMKGNDDEMTIQAYSKKRFTMKVSSKFEQISVD